MGRPALRAVVSHTELELVAVIVSSSTKEGQGAGALAGLDPVGVKVTRDVDQALADGLDAMVYIASGDFRPTETLADLERLPPTDPSPLRGAPMPPLQPVPDMTQGVEWAFEIPIRIRLTMIVWKPFEGQAS